MTAPQPPERITTAQQLRAMFTAAPAQLAEALLGCRLTVATPEGAVTVRLTETEAYGDAGADPGAHSFRGLTERNAALFGPVAHTYVYLNYGIHRCLNLVGHPEGQAGGVLMRSGEVTHGRELAVARRGRDTGAKLLSGPGNLGQGLGITLGMGHAPLVIADAHPDGAPTADLDVPADLAADAAELAADAAALAAGAPAGRGGARTAVVPGLRAPVDPVRFILTPPPPGETLAEVRRGPRVGVSGEGGSVRFPWRYTLAGERSVSAYRKGRDVPSAEG